MYPFPFVPDMGEEPTELVTDDFCWRMTLRGWRARRQSWGHRAERTAWRAEHAGIGRERRSI